MPIYSNLSDADLLLLITEGKEAAFTEIYNRYWERLVATGYYYTRSKQMAEEIVNDVLMGLWLRRASLVIHSLPAYLGTAVKFAVFKAIARNKKRNHILGSQLSPETEAGTAAIAHNDTEQQLDAIFMDEWVRGIVEQLPEKARLVFGYSRDEALSIKEIAGKMDMSPKTVEYHLTKALKAIRDSICKLSIFLHSLLS